MTTEKIAAPKGVPEYLPPVSAAWLTVRDTLARQAALAGYGYAELPVFEETALYVRGVGESTDVVSKEMYTFTDRGGRSLTLRPEGTAGAMRSVIEHHLDRGQLPVKLWYAGPCFRAERPQAGRYRQFHQFGVEAIGSDDPALDAEVIAIADNGFRDLGLTGYRLEITSLGCAQCRPAYREKLVAFLEGLDLDEPTRERARINPLRVLDDKRPEVVEQLADAPLMLDHLDEACAEHFAAVRDLLDANGTAYVVNPRMVRGLDYYTRTVFEVVPPSAGAQSTIGGGGRYDGLAEEIGGKPTPGVGFAAGLDRIILNLREQGCPLPAPEAPDVFFAPLGDEAKRCAAALADRVRREGASAVVGMGDRSMRARLRQADASGARWTVILGEDELRDEVVTVKDLRDGRQERVPFAELPRRLAASPNGEPS